jgi:predicted transcriptional regulator
MNHSLPTVTDAEWAVLQCLWDQGPASVRELRDALYPGGGPSEHATVHKLLERLEAKGYVRRDRAAGALTFHAVVARDDLIGQQLEELLEKRCGGSLQPLLSNLVRVKRVSAEELRELVALVEELQRKNKPRKERG